MPFEGIDRDNQPQAGTDAVVGINPWLSALVALLLGMTLTVTLVRNETRRSQQERENALTDAASEVAAAIRRQLSDCEVLIRTFQSVFLASEEVTPAEFGRVYDNLRPDRAGIPLQALAYAQRIRRRGGDRFITTMFVPVRGNEVIMGLDVGDQPSNLRALLESRDTNEVRMSAPFTLRQTAGQARPPVDGFILRLPVYAAGSMPATVAGRRRALTGSLGASFRVGDLIDAAMPTQPGLVAGIVVDDITSGVPRRLHRHQANIPAQGGVRRHQLRFGGRVWQLTIHGSGSGPAPWWGSSTFWLGTFASLLLAALSWSLISTRERALALGAAMSARFRASEERFRKLTELLPSLVLVAHRGDGSLAYQNAAARTRLGCDGGHGNLADVFDPAAMESVFHDPAGTPNGGDVQMTPAGAPPFWASVYISAIDIDDMPMWLIVASDVSEQRLLTERLSYHASHDSLTKLLNRREFEARITQALAAPGARAGALLFIDLDQFKLINDTSGHRAGDQLLVQLAAMMREKLRPGDILGRLGGDEFGVLISGVTTVEQASHAAERLRRSLEGYIFIWEQRTYTISGSIGGVLLTAASTLKELFAHADAACYLAKESGRNRVHFYSEDDAALTLRLGEMEWAGRLRDAMREGRLLLDFQELHSIQPGLVRPTHVELLLRLRAEDGREVMPGAFLPAAERYGMMPAIDRWVVETALRNIDRLHPAGTGLAVCAINLSSASLEDRSLVDLVAELIRSECLDPRRLLFEITETVAMRDFASSSALIKRLRGLGCGVALDDFGAGMSSFGYMKNLDLDMVKIDGSFIQELVTDRMSQSIVRAVTEIGHQQGLAVVAEWVSSGELVELLRRMGVDYAQGFALHRPERVLFQRGSG